MNIFLVYLLSFIGTSIIDALWHLVVFGKQYGEWFAPVARMVNGQIAVQWLPGVLSQLLIVSSIMFVVLYKTKGRPKMTEAALMGSIGGILSVSVYGLVNFSLINNWGLEITILEFIWGPMMGVASGIFVAYLAKKLL